MKSILKIAFAAFMMIVPLSAHANNNVIDWGNGFTTTYNDDGSSTTSGPGINIEYKDGQLMCNGQPCEQFAAYNSTLVQDLLTRIAPAAGDVTPVITPPTNNNTPETTVLLNGEIPVIQQNVVNNQPPVNNGRFERPIKECDAGCFIFDAVEAQ